jgi:hypothetical protein
MLRRLRYLALLLFLLAFPYGPLFPWSPVRPGYRSERFRHADVVYPNDMTLPAAYQQVDSFIEQAEQFHQLKIPNRITVIACRSWEDFHRFVPHLQGRGIAAVTLVPGTVIYVTPRTGEKGLDTAEFLRHELSHAALNQNQSAWNGYKAAKHGWFFEGLAVSFGKQKAYVTRDEFLTRAHTEDLGPVIDPDQHASGPRDMRFSYVAWRYFLEDLVQTRGRDRFQGLLTGFMADPDREHEVFRQIYGESLGEAVRDFQSRVNQER